MFHPEGPPRNRDPHRVAGRSGAPFFGYISGSDFVEMFVVGASRWRKRTLKKAAPANIFIDEVVINVVIE